MTCKTQKGEQSYGRSKEYRNIGSIYVFARSRGSHEWHAEYYPETARNIYEYVNGGKTGKFSGAVSSEDSVGGEECRRQLKYQ